MFTLSLLSLLFVAVHAEPFNFNDGLEWKEGPCPKPKTLTFKPQQYAGMWYGVYTQYPLEKTRSCMQNIVYVDYPDKFYTSSHFVDASGKKDGGVSRSLPVPGEPGMYNLEHQFPNGTWVNDGWVYSFVGSSGRANLDYMCKQEGSQHIEFYRIRNRSNRISPATVKTLTQIPKEYGNTEEFVKIDQTNCDYYIA